MNAISKRVGKLEKRMGLGPESKQILYFLCHAGVTLALDHDTCVQILREGGFLPTGPVGMLNFLHVPHDLNAEELERFLRERGAETRW